MVARINTGQSIRKALNYNEKKVQKGDAECIGGGNLPIDPREMTFHNKCSQFEKLTTLNERTKTNTVHISLNFDPSEKLDDDTMKAIADAYMQKIGFGDQPYIIYRHHDSGHPHIHIVTTNIRKDGSRISTHNLGRNESEKARKQIEIDFDLVNAESKSQRNQQQIKPVNAQKILTGEQTVKASMSNVLAVVIPQYKYASLEELNAVLVLYNMKAERGGKNSETYNHEGLLYRVLDENGKVIGTPVKASRFYMKPTLKNLRKRFEENEKAKQPYAKRLRSKIDLALETQNGKGTDAFIEQLAKDNISVVLRKSKDGKIYGITYVDHRSKTVFNGSDLGKKYSAKEVQEQAAVKHISTTEKSKDVEKPAQKQSSMKLKTGTSKSTDAAATDPKSDQQQDILPEPTKTFDYVPGWLKRKRKSKKKKRFKF